MSIIGIEGIEVKAPVGVYSWEKEEGRIFLVDVTLETDIDFSNIEDELDQTIDYEKVCNIVKANMVKKFNLIETVLEEIYKGIIKEYPNLIKVRLKVRKLNPIRNEKVNSAFVETLFIK